MYTGSVVETGAEAAVKQGAETAAKTGAETAVKTGAEAATEAAVERSFLEKTGDVMFRGGQSPEQIAAGGVKEGAAYLAETPKHLQTAAGFEAAKAAAGPGLIARFGPTALAGTAIAGGAGFFDVPETERANFLDYNDDGTVTTGRDLIDADPGKFLVKDLGSIRLNEETGEYEPFGSSTMLDDEDLTGYAPPQQAVAFNTPIDQQNYLRSSTPGGPFARPYVTEEYQGAADGGPIFPRRTGGIAPTEGTKGEDSVRAMLMPGEFVMTTDAVRGLGDGNLNNGIKNMYSVMRNLESRGRATA